MAPQEPLGSFSPRGGPWGYPPSSTLRQAVLVLLIPVNNSLLLTPGDFWFGARVSDRQTSPSRLQNPVLIPGKWVLTSLLTQQ